MLLFHFMHCRFLPSNSSCNSFSVFCAGRFVYSNKEVIVALAVALLRILFTVAISIRNSCAIQNNFRFKMEISECSQKKRTPASGREWKIFLHAMANSNRQHFNFYSWRKQQEEGMRKMYGPGRKGKSLEEWTTNQEVTSDRKAHKKLATNVWVNSSKLKRHGYRNCPLVRKLDAQRYARRIQIQTLTLSPRNSEAENGKKKDSHRIFCRLTCQCSHGENSINSIFSSFFCFCCVSWRNAPLLSGWYGVRLHLLRTENNNFAFWFNFEYKFC